MVVNQLYKVDNKNSGIKESRDISEKALSIVKEVFQKHFDKEKYSLFSWGGVARREMGPFSDLDLILLSIKPEKRKIEKFKKELQSLLPSHRLDILEVYTERELIRLAQIDGTDRQALLFLRKEFGSNDSDIADIIKKDSENNLREIFHICANLEFAYPKMFDVRNIKFGEGGIKYYCFAHLLANYLKSSFDIFSTQEAFEYLAINGFLDKEIVKKATANFDKLLSIRNSLHRVANKEINILEDELVEKVCNDFGINQNDLFGYLAESKDFILTVFDLFKKICIDLGSERLSNIDIMYLKNVFLNSKEVSLSKGDILELSEISKMIAAYSSKDSNTLDLLAKKNPYNWYILYGIANNTKVSKKTLWRLIVPSNDEDKRMEGLYKDFAWRNIYLYVAKNPTASKDIRKYICNYPKARPMDIEAASKGL